MIGLGIRLFRGRLPHGGVLFERLVVFFDAPPSLVDCRQLHLIQARIAADQLYHALRPILSL